MAQTGLISAARNQVPRPSLGTGIDISPSGRFRRKIVSIMPRMLTCREAVLEAVRAVVREEEHNEFTVDQIVHRLRDSGPAFAERVLMVRGRGGFEIVQKQGRQACRWLLPYRRLRAWRCGLRGSFGLPWSDF